MATSRRAFIGAAVLGGGAAALGIGYLATRAKRDRVRVALIGAGGQGLVLAKAFTALSNCELVTVCDADTDRAYALCAALEKDGVDRPKTEQDFRRVLDDKTIAAVIIATPHHWHALSTLWALRAGKHVYLEKPVTHSVREGAVLRAAAAYHGLVVQSGTHRRSMTGMDRIAEHIRAGKLGKVKLARAIAYRPRKPMGKAGHFKPPATLNYDLWAGPAPMAEVTRKKFHYNWHFFWPYGNGGLGNNGVHRIDLVRWGLGLTGLGDSVLSYGARLGPVDAAETPNTQVAIHKFGDLTVVHELRSMKTPAQDGAKSGVVFFGTEGRIVWDKDVGTLYDPAGKEISTFDNESHSPSANFLDAVTAKNPKLLHGGLEEGIQSAALVHVASISHRVGRVATDDEIGNAITAFGGNDDAQKTFARTRQHATDNGATGDFTLGAELTFAPGEERIANNADAEVLMGDTYRAPYTLPDAATVKKSG